MATKKRDHLLATYQKLLATRARKDRLRPARMQTLKTDPEWTQAVADERQAHEAFDKAAEAYCKEASRVCA